jgi:hypothetical protein
MQTLIDLVEAYAKAYHEARTGVAGSGHSASDRANAVHAQIELRLADLDEAMLPEVAETAHWILDGRP